jgi:hypothetical protein
VVVPASESLASLLQRLGNRDAGVECLSVERDQHFVLGELNVLNLLDEFLCVPDEQYWWVGKVVFC